MIILTLRSDKPEAEIGLYENENRLAYESWEAHRQLAETLHRKIEDLLISQDKSWQQVEGIVVFQGPGSFTGLRIGLSVCNAVAASTGAKIVASQDTDWITTGIARLMSGEDDKQALPEYGAPVHITQQKR